MAEMRWLGGDGVVLGVRPWVHQPVRSVIYGQRRRFFVSSMDADLLKYIYQVFFFSALK